MLLCPAKSSVTSYVVPTDVTEIGPEAFRACESVKSVTLHSGVKSIGSYAFYACKNLESLDIPSGVTEIGTLALSGTKFYSSLTDEFVIRGDGILIKYNPIRDNTQSPAPVVATDYAELVYRTVTVSGKEEQRLYGVSLTLPTTVKSISSAFK